MWLKLKKKKKKGGGKEWLGIPKQDSGKKTKW